MDWRTGVRFDLRYYVDFIYPLLAFEVGYWENHGLYIGFKADVAGSIISSIKSSD